MEERFLGPPGQGVIGINLFPVLIILSAGQDIGGPLLGISCIIIISGICGLPQN